MPKQKHNRPPLSQLTDWRPPFDDLDDATQVNPTELEDIEQHFMDGIQKAKKSNQRKHRLPINRWPVALACVIVLVVLVVLGPIFIHDRPAPIAEPYPGMQGQVVSACDIRPVSGVQVWLKERDKQPGRFFRRNTSCLIDITDAAGFFDIPAGEFNRPRQVVLKHAGEKVAQFNEIPGAQDFQGYQQIWITGSGALDEENFWFDITPGSRKSVGQRVTVSLDASAANWWYGTLVRNQRWPAPFSYSCVLDGIYSLDGDPATGLTLTVRLDEAALQVFRAMPEDVVLLVHSDAYEKQDHKSGFHRGWYRADAPPAGYGLSSFTSKLSYNKHGNASLSWPATPGVQYALQVPMTVTGDLAFVYYYANGADPECRLQQRIMLLNQNQPQLYTVEAWLDRLAGLGWQELTTQPRVHQPFYELVNSVRLPEAPEDGSLFNPPGRWKIDLVDFTLQERHSFEIDAPVAVPQPGHFQLELTPGGVGGISKASITGDVDRLAQPPAWDIGCDYVDEAYGMQVEIPAPYPSSYKVRVTLHEKNGAISVLDGSIEVADPSLPLYAPGPFNSVPVLNCTSAVPHPGGNIQVMTASALANPLPYGYSVSHLAGPVWRCRLPDEYTGVPVKRVRIVQSASRLAGDVEQAELQPVLRHAPREQAGPMITGMSSWTLPDGANADLCNEGLSHVARYVVVYHRQGVDLHELLTHGEFYDYYVAGVKQSIHDKLGWDLAHLPPDEQLVAEAQAFIDSAAFGRRKAAGFGENLIWEFETTGMQVPSGEDLLLEFSLETQGLLVAAQWDLQSFPGAPSYIEIEVEGQPKSWRGYFDYRPLYTPELW